MANYRINVRKSAAKELGVFPTKDLQRIADKILALATDPRPFGAEKLSGDPKYRIRQGVYRILYEVDDQALVVTIVKIGHRREIYR